VVGVVAKHTFAGQVDVGTLNFAVALLAGAPALANILSFVWAAVSHGRHKVRTITLLQVGAAAMVALVAIAPRNLAGLLIMVFCVLGARVCWSGVTILRSTIWHANYPRHARATLAGKFATMQAVVMAVAGIGIGVAMDFDDRAFRIAYPAAAVLALLGVFVYSRLRVRGHRVLLAAERKGIEAREVSINPLQFRRVLRDDSKFRHYMTCMYVFGFGNLMVVAPLVIMLRDRFALRESISVLIASTIPFLLMPVSIPVWSRLLDRMHIIQFRAIHAWAFVTSIVAVLLAALTMQVWLLYVAAVLKGVAIGGGVLGWNLGHHDFAPPDRVSQYMGVHVTLTGMRGMVAPVLAVSIYEGLRRIDPWAGAWVFAVALALSVSGAVGFVLLARSTSRADAAAAARNDEKPDCDDCAPAAA